MRHLYLTLFYCSFAFVGFSQTVQLQSFATGFSDPTEMAHIEGDNKLFIVEKAGIIKILNTDGSVNSTPFLDISTIVGSGGERGLLGLAFAPDYATSGRFYVNYTDNSSTSTPNTIIARYTVSADPNIANTSGSVLLTINQPFNNHNGGKLLFGTDGFLYIGTGDGGSGGDPGDRAQDPTTLLGKLLRIDVSGATYSIPPSNPFSGSADGPTDPRPEIYAIGLRNPWKFSFDKNTQNLWIADVGQSGYEEINNVSASGTPGDNYGWSCYEGNNHIFNTDGNCPPAGGFSATVAPVAEYPHVGDQCSGSITGGYVYRGTTLTSFIGKYFFADYCKQTIGILTDTGSGWSLAFQTPNIAAGWTSFGEDADGELYIVGGSTVYKITDPNLGSNENETFNFNIFPNPSKGHITLHLSSQSDEVESVSIYNMQGQKIKDFTKPNQQKINISTENFASGLYFVNIRLTNNLKSIKKLIVN